jgi:5-methylcytosine-specific restriction enzyme subunit McrC
MNILYENQNIPKKLEHIIQKDTTLHPFFESCFNGIKPKNYCGFLSLESQNYFIIPKISNNDENSLNIFIYMLLYAYDIKISQESLSNLSNLKSKIVEIFIRYFANVHIDELKKGVYKTYITQEENLKLLRGKYLIDKNFSNFYHQNITCEFDEFTTDNKLNRFFLFAITIFQKYSTFSNLHLCELMLDEVSYEHIEINKIDISFDRLSDRFEKSFLVALLILKKLIPLTSTSSQKSFIFLFDMAEVFEKFIGNLYKNIDSSTKLQYQKNFGNLQLKPDIITQDLIIDTKYKIVKNRNDLATNDKYQMFAYGTNFERKNCMLLYPKHFNLDFKNEDLKLGIGEKMINLKMRSIDLKCEDIGYDEYVNEIKRRLEQI